MPPDAAAPFPHVEQSRTALARQGGAHPSVTSHPAIGPSDPCAPCLCASHWPPRIRPASRLAACTHPTADPPAPPEFPDRLTPGAVRFRENPGVSAPIRSIACQDRTAGSRRPASAPILADQAEEAHDVTADAPGPSGDASSIPPTPQAAQSPLHLPSVAYCSRPAIPPVRRPAGPTSSRAPIRRSLHPERPQSGRARIRKGRPSRSALRPRLPQPSCPHSCRRETRSGLLAKPPVLPAPQRSRMCRPPPSSWLKYPRGSGGGAPGPTSALARAPIS